LYRCVNCGGVDFDYGNVVTAGLIMQRAYDPRVFYKSNNKKILRAKTPLGVEVCMDCGHCEIYMDMDHLKKRIK
jgi:hypothetical protein